MNSPGRRLTQIVIVSFILTCTFWPPALQAQAPFDDLTPNQLTFVGRRGTTYTADWDPNTYEVIFSTPDSTFPWDWIGFVGRHGSVALNGYAGVGNTFAMSDPNAIAGAKPGDLFRIKGNGVLGLAHLTKIGLVIGSGAGAQRAWLSDGNITRYTMAPHYVGYRVEVLGRIATVRITSLNPQSYYAVAVVEVSLDNPTGARVLLATDLEPVMDYSYAVELHNRNDTTVSFNSSSQVLVGTQDYSANPVYVYSSQPLHSWSGNNLTFAQYLAADRLDNRIRSGRSDGRVALSVVAQPVQYFYVGSLVLDSATRAYPISAWNALWDARLAQLHNMPVVDSLAMPKFKFVNFLSNLSLTYLVNPNGGLFYTDKAFMYVPDSIMPLIVTPHILPSGMVDAFKEGLQVIAAQRYQTPVSGNYGYKIDTRTWSSLPSWYAGNLPDIIHFRPNGDRYYRENYSDAYATAEFVNGVYALYQVTGNLAYAQSYQSAVSAAISGLQAFDTGYDSVYGQDGNLFPNLRVPMGDLGGIAGEYPGETAQTVYAYEDAAALLRLYGQDVQADQLLNNYVAPMQAAFDTRFWNDNFSFYLPVADRYSLTRTPATFYQDFWAHTLFVPLRGNLGQNRLAAMLDVFTGPDFFEPEGDVHWLAKGSDNFATPGRWGLSTSYTNGWGMEGGYLVLPNVIAPLGYYQLGQTLEAEAYANVYFDKWIQYGPYEAGMEYDGQMPGKFGESSIYIEAASGTTWLLQMALGLEVDGMQVTITPKLSGQFAVRDLHITAMGRTAVVDYARDGQGHEWINVRSNQGLTICAPNVTPCTTSTATSTPTPTSTQTPASTNTATATGTPTSIPTNTPTPTATATPVATCTSTPTVSATPVPTATPTLTVTPTGTPTNTPTPTATATPAATNTLTPTASATLVPTATPTLTVTPTNTPTNTPTPTATPRPAVVTVDNTDPGFSTVGSWILFSGGGYPSYGPSFVYSYPGSGTDRAVFRLGLPVAGEYEVFIWWGTTPTAATNQPFTINYDGGSVTIRVNFQGATGGGEWRSLGVYRFVAGTSGNVVTSDDADSLVGADAVQWVQVVE